MNETEDAISAWEARLPFLAADAFRKAREQALAAGLSVMESEDGMIYETFPDGHRRPVMAIPPPIPVEKGRRIHLNH